MEFLRRLLRTNSAAQTIQKRADVDEPGETAVHFIFNKEAE